MVLKDRDFINRTDGADLFEAKGSLSELSYAKRYTYIEVIYSPWHMESPVIRLFVKQIALAIQNKGLRTTGPSKDESTGDFLHQETLMC